MSDIKWTKIESRAQYAGADWSTHVKTIPNSSPEAAQEYVANTDRQISFFFYVREFMNLSGHGDFNAGDAVFFTGLPWYGTAPQCDAYQREDLINALTLGRELNELYLHYFFGVPLPRNFPESIIRSFPNRSYKAQLKAAIAQNAEEIVRLEAEAL